MSSANIVAQKPAGNFNPLSLLGHVWLLVCAPVDPGQRAAYTECAESACASAGSRVFSKQTWKIAWTTSCSIC